ncbi:MAG: hypothetical protein AAGA03_00910 [Planctomycetota bacterium]
MKKRLIALLIMAVVSVSGLGALLYGASRANQALQQPVMEAIAEEDASGFLQLCSPELRLQIDRPLLEDWLTAMHQSLGDLQHTSGQDFDVRVQLNSAGKITRCRGQVVFQRGIATSKLVFLNDRLVEFDIESDTLPSGWFRGPGDTSIYESHATKMMENLLAGEIDAVTPMMHPALQENVPPAKLKQIRQVVMQWVGQQPKIATTRAEFHRANEPNPGDDEKLVVHGDVVGPAGKANMTVTFLFIGMKAHVVEFNFTPNHS